jgi:hypothetical protein
MAHPGRVPWTTIAKSTNKYIAPEYLPSHIDFDLSQPTKLKLNVINSILQHWQVRQSKSKTAFQFRSHSLSKQASKGKGKAKVIRWVSSDDEEDGEGKDEQDEDNEEDQEDQEDDEDNDGDNNGQVRKAVIQGKADRQPENKSEAEEEGSEGSDEEDQANNEGQAKEPKVVQVFSNKRHSAKVRDILNTIGS